MMQDFRKDLLRYLPSEVIPALLAFVTIPLLTRILSVSQFGHYALVISLATTMVTLLSWLKPSVVRYYPSLPASDTPTLVRTIFWAQAVAAGASGIVVYLVARVLWPTEVAFQRLLGLGVALFIVQSMFLLLVEVLRARFQASAYSLFMIWMRVAGLASGVLLVVGFHLGAAGMLWGPIIGVAIVLPFLWQRVFTGFSAIGGISLPLLRALSGYGIPVVVGNLGAQVLSQCDRYFIGWFYSAHEVGIYAAAYSIAQHSIMTLGALFRLSSGPVFATVWEQEGEGAVKRLLYAVTRLYVLVGIPVVVGMSVLAQPIMQVLTSAEFLDGYTVIPWVVSGAFFLGLQHRFNQVLLLVKRTGTITFWLLVSGFLNIALNWWLLPLYGYQIAAVTTLISYVFLAVVQAVASRRYVQWAFPWATTVRSLCAAGLMGSGIVLVTHSMNLQPLWQLCVAVPLGGLLYGVSLWACGELSAAELAVLQSGGRRWLPQRLVRP